MTEDVLVSEQLHSKYWNKEIKQCTCRHIRDQCTNNANNMFEDILVASSYWNNVIC